MSYCTRQDLIDRGWELELIQLTDREGVGEINDVILQQAMDDATNDINSYLHGHYQLPLPSVPVVLTRLSCDLTRYYLFDSSVTEQVEKRYKAVIHYLEQVAKGTILLPVDASNVSTTENVAILESAGKQFGRAPL